MSKNLSRRGFVATLAACAAATRPVLASAPLQIGFVYPTPLAPVGWTAQHDQGRRQLERALGAQIQTGRQVVAQEALELLEEQPSKNRPIASILLHARLLQSLAIDLALR